MSLRKQARLLQTNFEIIGADLSIAVQVVEGSFDKYKGRIKRRASGVSSCLKTPTALGAQVQSVIPGHGRATEVQNDTFFSIGLLYWNGCLQQLNQHSYTAPFLVLFPTVVA